MLRKFWFVLIGLVAFSSIALIISWQFSRPATGPKDNLVKEQPPAIQSAADLPTATSASPLLAQVQPAIKLPSESEFMVSGGSATATIRFIEGSIKPLDVHVGDTQNFRIVVMSPNGIKRVIAEIETDNGIHEVELAREGLISILDTYPNPYVVNPNDNTLQILNQDQLAQARLEEHQRELAQQKANQANAAAGQREVWTGSWVVKDVHAKTYFTNFIAYDSAGNQEKLTMTWSDLCNIKYGGSWTSASTTAGCIIPENYVDGVDNGDVTLVQNKNLNLSTGATFIWNPLRSVNFSGGSLFLAANKASQLKQGYLYAPDADNDWYTLPGGLSNQIFSTSTTPPTGYTRRNILLGENDCSDNHKWARPGASLYSAASFVNQVDVGLDYDWNCDHNEEVDPRQDLSCNSTSTYSRYQYKLCKDYDTGGCCGSGGGGNTKAPNFQFARIAQADDVACCNGRQTLTGCFLSNTKSIGSDSCGQERDFAWDTSVMPENSTSCVGGKLNFQVYSYGEIGCR